jgi:hypothetical protein
MTLTIAQKILLGVLLALVVLMIIFSVQSLQHRGKSGFDMCIQQKCEDGGQAYCEKLREISNCCQGSGGRVAQSPSGYTCVFG